MLWLAGAVAAELGSHRAFGRLAPLAAPGAGLAFGAPGRQVSPAVPLAFALAAGAWLLLTRPGPDPAAAGGAGAEAAPPSSTGGVLDGDQVPDAVREEAITATAGARSSFGALAALQDHFRSGRFTYDDGPEAPTGHGLFQVAQLLDEREGTAEQFASAFAVMADGLGYRARVVVGYLPGRATAAPHVVEVSARHAHAWPEVLFDDLGWVPFEPSPLDRRVVPAGPDEEAVDAPATDAVQTAVTEEVADQRRPSPVTAPGPGGGPDDQPAVPGGTEGDRSWGALAVAVGLGALGRCWWRRPPWWP